MKEQLIALLGNKEFVEKIAKMDTVEEVMAAVKAEGADVSREEFDEVMNEIARFNAKQDGEFNEAELENVAGGFSLTAAAVVAAVTALVGGLKWLIYDEPYNRGKRDAAAENNKRKNGICK